MPAIKSGFKLLTKLRDSGTGASKLSHIIDLWRQHNKVDLKGKPNGDIDAEDVVEYIENSPDELVPEVTKLKARDFHLYGEYTPVQPPKADADFADLEATFELLPDGEPEETPAKGKKAKASAKSKASKAVAKS